MGLKELNQGVAEERGRNKGRHLRSGRINRGGETGRRKMRSNAGIERISLRKARRDSEKPSRITAVSPGSEGLRAGVNAPDLRHARMLGDTEYVFCVI